MGRPVSLVTGACSFLGSHLVEVLVEAGHEVRATDLAESLERDDLKSERFPSVLEAYEVERLASDLRAPSTLAPIVDGVDYVFHAASAPAKAPRSLAQAINVQGTRALVDLLLEPQRRERLRRLVLFSAGGIYGHPSPYDLPLREDTPPAPSSDALKSKWAQEWLVIEAGRKQGLPFSTLRPTGIYGPRGVTGIGRLLIEAARRKVLAVPSSFNARVALVHVRDVVRAALAVATDDRALGEAYNVTDHSLMSRFDLLKAVAAISGARFLALPPVPPSVAGPLLRGSARVGALITARVTHRPTTLEAGLWNDLSHDYVYSNDKLKQLGFDFLYPEAYDGIAETVAWYREQGWLEPGAGGA